MSWPAVKFVASMDVTAAVRLDMSTGRGGVWVDADGFSLGAPGYDGEPTAPASQYGYRTLEMLVKVNGTKAVALATLAALWRELDRDENYLLFQLQPTSTPVWYHTYKTQPEALSLERVYDESSGKKLPDTWQIRVALAADGLGSGAVETLVTNAVVNMDAAAGSNPCRYVIATAIKGDVPAPLVVNCSWAQAKHGYRHLVAVARSNGYVWQIGGSDGWTAGTDTAASSADATFSGGTLRVVSFATVPGMAARISGAAPAAVTNGRYRVLVRAARSDTSSQFAFRFGQLITFNYVYGDTVRAAWNASTATNHAAWIDLGEHDFPVATDQPGTITPNIALDAQRISGTGTCKLDAIKLIPLDGTTLFVNHSDLGPGGSGLFRGIHDSEAERFYHRDTSGPINGQIPAMAGAWPQVEPGNASTNVVHILSQTSPDLAANFWGDAPDRIADTVQVTLTYRPGYMQIPA